MSAKLASTLVLLAPLLLVPLVFVAVLRAGPEPSPLWRSRLPDQPSLDDRCTWSCHNHGCRHAPRLPSRLAGDEGLFGATVRALHQAGAAIAPGRGGVGYGAANLLLFCLAWPGVMYALFVIAVVQRRRLRELRQLGRRP